MSRRIRNIIYLTALILLTIAAVSFEQSFFDELSNKNISRQAQRYITNKSQQIDHRLTEIADMVMSGEELWISESENDLLIYITTRNSVKYWNSNRISPEDIPFSENLTCRRIDNAWFLYRSIKIYHYRIDVLANIKNNYSINNDYFKNDDADQSELSHYSISEVPQIGYSPVFGENNQPLFYFNKTELNEHNRRHSLWATVLYFVLFFAVLIFLSLWHQNNFINFLSVLLFGLVFISSVHYLNLIPIFNRTEIFLGNIALSEQFMSSIGMMSLAAIFWIVLSYITSRNVLKFRPNKRQAFAITLLLLVSFYFIIQFYINILNNSSINLQLYRIRKISAESLWIFGIFILFISGWGRLANICTGSFRSHKYAYLYPILALIASTPLLIKCPVPIISGAIFLSAFIFSLKRKRRVGQFMFVNLLIAAMLLSFMMTILTERESLKKNAQDKKALLQTLPASMLYERDYTVEENLVDIWNEMQNDITLKNMPRAVFNSTDYYYNYLKKTYFNDILKEYDLQVVICTPDMDLNLAGAKILPNCYNFFSEMIHQQGNLVENSGFYWQKNNNGRVSYLGWLKISEGTIFETSIFIDLESPILSEGRGYPQMLRESTGASSSIPALNSFARYANNKLITSSGDFRYPPSAKWIPNFDGEFKNIDFDRQSHLCYKISEESYVVLSEAKSSFLYPVYAYIYNFLMYYLTFLFIHLMTKKHHKKISQTISNDIRLTIFGVLFLSLILVGTTSVLYPLNVYKQNQLSAINDKGESFLNSISRELSGVSNIHEVSQSALQGLVQSLSNTLSNDVHIYDLNGRLYASSRPQLFNYKLQGNIICPQAYKAFKYQNLTSKIHNERIGNNVYKSSYYVISNAVEEPIAYINVPFFSSQQDLQKSITDFVVLLFNIYLILVILVVVFTFFSVNTITKPLFVIQEGMSKMRLGSNEKIEYSRHDEIGSLVEKYNVMVDELNASAEQLAKSEREVAWQGMARQIAHEIKNPLTPMKLSIQHLARTKMASPEAFDEYFKKTANTLIEQIDNLSSIATSFSTFAKISDGVPERIYINDRLQNIVTLFEQSGSNVHYQGLDDELFVNMDKDHFRQIFNNLIKNALQAIPEDREGKIEMHSKVTGHMVNIYVKDNGNGIEEEMRDKIFQPNFTTKNSGMGLGLAISQKMATNAGGDISFNSVLGQGTTFVVRLPLGNIEN